tara:strand:- start:34 stop:333 length:300 start_codon:yes stop_codon:yes gene_type:complete
MNNIIVKVGTVLDTLPPKNQFGKPRTIFYKREWDKKLVLYKGKWIILDIDKNASTFWNMASKYNQRYNSLGYVFEYRNINGTNCLIGAYKPDENNLFNT